MLRAGRRAFHPGPRPGCLRKASCDRPVFDQLPDISCDTFQFSIALEGPFLLCSLPSLAVPKQTSPSSARSRPVLSIPRPLCAEDSKGTKQRGFCEAVYKHKLHTFACNHCGCRCAPMARPVGVRAVTPPPEPACLVSDRRDPKVREHCDEQYASLRR
jgi:hypothetical protein